MAGKSSKGIDPHALARPNKPRAAHTCPLDHSAPFPSRVGLWSCLLNVVIFEYREGL